MSIPKLTRISQRKFIIIDEYIYGCVVTNGILAWCGNSKICSIDELLMKEKKEILQMIDGKDLIKIVDYLRENRDEFY